MQQIWQKLKSERKREKKIEKDRKREKERIRETKIEKEKIREKKKENLKKGHVRRKGENGKKMEITSNTLLPGKTFQILSKPPKPF
jgi:hypothetical protein